MTAPTQFSRGSLSPGVAVWIYNIYNTDIGLWGHGLQGVADSEEMNMWHRHTS